MPWGKDRSERDAVLAPAVAAAGGPSAVARALGITKAAVGQWRQVPDARLTQFARLSGFPARILRPDLHDKKGRRRKGPDGATRD